MKPAQQETFINYLQQRAAAIQADTVRLMDDHRADEANFEKIRANIFQIIKTILTTAVVRREPEKRQEELLVYRLNLFHDTWNAALEKAQAHGDQLRVRQEQVKLEALEEIRKRFEQLREVEV